MVSIKLLSYRSLYVFGVLLVILILPFCGVPDTYYESIHKVSNESSRDIRIIGTCSSLSIDTVIKSGETWESYRGNDYFTTAPKRFSPLYKTCDSVIVLDADREDVFNVYYNLSAISDPNMTNPSPDLYDPADHRVTVLIPDEPGGYGYVSFVFTFKDDHFK